MEYYTRYYGSPYGINGEYGDNTTSPAKLAKKTLQPGQHMDVHQIGNPEPCKRYRCGSDGKVAAVNL